MGLDGKILEFQNGLNDDSMENQVADRSEITDEITWNVGRARMPLVSMVSTLKFLRILSALQLEI